MGSSGRRGNMMKITQSRNSLTVSFGEVKLRKRNMNINEFPKLFRMFISFEEGHDWNCENEMLFVRHSNLAELALVYLSLRSANATAGEARTLVNSLRMFEVSSLASILWYRLSILNGGKSRFLRNFGKALLKMFREA